ncbi:hypothetical protein [Spirosoma fluminis]
MTRPPLHPLPVGLTRLTSAACPLSPVSDPTQSEILYLLMA